MPACPQAAPRTNQRHDFLSAGEKTREAERLGVQAFLTKPYTAADLLQTLVAVLAAPAKNSATTVRKNTDP